MYYSFDLLESHLRKYMMYTEGHGEAVIHLLNFLGLWAPIVDEQ